MRLRIFSLTAMFVICFCCLLLLSSSMRWQSFEVHSNELQRLPSDHPEAHYSNPHHFSSSKNEKSSTKKVMVSITSNKQVHSNLATNTPHAVLSTDDDGRRSLKEKEQASSSQEKYQKNISKNSDGFSSSSSSSSSAFFILPFGKTKNISSYLSQSSQWVSKKGTQEGEGKENSLIEKSRDKNVCGQIREHHIDQYKRIMEKLNNLRKPPLYTMPWYYYNPAPLCGRFLVTHYYDSSLLDRLLFRLKIHGGDDGRALQSTSSTHHSNKEDQPHKKKNLLINENNDVGKEESNLIIQKNSGKTMAVIDAVVGEENRIVEITSCDDKPYPALNSQLPDIYISARLVGEQGYYSASIIPTRGGMKDDFTSLSGEIRKKEDRFASYRQIMDYRHAFVSFTPHEVGEFQLEVKLIHLNGTSDDPIKPKSLGVIGIRCFENGAKSYRYNDVCDAQRHVYGSPIKVVVRKGDNVEKNKQKRASSLKNSEVSSTPFCTRANHTDGRWVRVSKSACLSESNPYCRGDPSWLSDAAGFNTEMVWVPTDCKYRLFSPHGGPGQSCIRSSAAGAKNFLLIGDSVIREYHQNCKLFHLRAAKLTCVFHNIALEGKHYSRDYAVSIVKVMIGNLRSTNAGVFATNLGLHHMIGPCNTAQWSEFVEIFAEHWKANVSRTTTSSSSSNDDMATTNKIFLEKAIWIGPPAIQYSNRGMGFQRAKLWDAIAWAALEPLGFRRLYAIAPTLSRQEATWDGLHYAAQKGKLYAPWRNPKAKVLPWNGGVSNMLFLMLLNLVCYGD